jgi:hypothetical protein
MQFAASPFLQFEVPDGIAGNKPPQDNSEDLQFDIPKKFEDRRSHLEGLPFLAVRRQISRCFPVQVQDKKNAG